MTEKTATAPTKPARSPVERAIVWGVIGIGLAVILMEGKSYMAHASALSTLQTKLKEFNDSETDGGMTKKDVDAVIGGREPDETTKLGAGTTAMGADRLDIYNFQGLLRNRQLYVYYGIAGKIDQGAEVMEVSTGASETLEEAMAKLPPPTPAGPGTDGPGGAAPPGGPGAGGPRTGGPMGASGPMGAGPAAPGRRGNGGATPAGRPTAEGDETKKDADSATEKKDSESKAATETPEAKPDEAKADEAKPEAAKADEAKTE